MGNNGGQWVRLPDEQYKQFTSGGAQWALPAGYAIQVGSFK